MTVTSYCGLCANGATCLTHNAPRPATDPIARLKTHALLGAASYFGTVLWVVMSR